MDLFVIIWFRIEDEELYDLLKSLFSMCRRVLVISKVKDMRI